jgi:hypothetical protein
MAGMSMTLMAGVAVVVIIVIAAAALVMYHPNGSSGNNSGANGNGANGKGSTTVASTTVALSGTGGGPGQYYMSQSEVSALSVSGGAYNASGNVNATEMAMYLSQYSKNDSGIFANNVTAMWVMSYDVNSVANGRNMSQAVIEMVFQSPVAAQLYAKSMAKATSSYNASDSNVTVNGLKYSYLGTSSVYFSLSGLVGYKDNYFVDVFDFGGDLPQAQLAATVAGDLP